MHKIIKHICSIGYEDRYGFQKELNIISWNGRERKYDIRGWDKSHDKMTKGITFSSEELEQLKEELKRLNIEGV